MKLATGLCIWVSLLVAAGTVQPGASQSGGSRAAPPRGAPGVEPAAAGVAASGASFAPLPNRRPAGSLARTGRSIEVSSAGWRGPWRCPQTRRLCVHALLLTANIPLHPCPLFPGERRVAPAVRDAGDQNPELGETLLSASGPSMGAAGERRAPPGLRSGWGPGRAVRRGSSENGRCTRARWRGSLRPQSPSVARSAPTRAQPERLQRRAGPPWPGGPGLGASSAGVPELSPRALQGSLPARLTSEENK